MAAEEALLARNLTWRDIQERIDSGRDIAVLPVGSTEMHGPQLPLGTDTYIAEAVSRMAAQTMDAVVFDTFPYTYSGSTQFSRGGTISLTIDEERMILHAIIRELARNGFGRIYMICFHGAELAREQVVRESVAENIPLVFFPLMQLTPSNNKDVFLKKGLAWEPSLLAAAADYLCVSPRFTPDACDGYPLEPNEFRVARSRIAGGGGHVGKLSTHELHHGAFTKPIDKPLAREALEQMAKAISATSEDMKLLRDSLATIDVKDSWTKY